MREHGGYVHEALALSNATDCGSRCVLTTHLAASRLSGDVSTPLTVRRRQAGGL